MSTSSLVILITGTSRGLGQHLLEVMRAQGHVVYGSSRHPDGSDPHELALDVTSEESCQHAVAHVLAQRGHIDVLINNAGSHLHGAAIETSDEELRAQMALNFFGVVSMTRAVLPHMLERRTGRVMNISSVGGRLATPFTSAYAASKFALEGYMEALRLEVLPFGVHVSNLTPAYLKTGTTDQSVISVQHAHPLFEAYRQDAHAHLLREGAAHGAPLEHVSNTVLKLLAARTPPFRASVDGMVTKLLWARALSPGKFFERSVVKQTAPELAKVWS